MMGARPPAHLTPRSLTVCYRKQQISGLTLLQRAALHVLESSCAILTRVTEMGKQTYSLLYNDNQMLQCALGWLETGCLLGEGSWSIHRQRGTAGETYYF